MIHKGEKKKKKSTHLLLPSLFPRQLRTFFSILSLAIYHKNLGANIYLIKVHVERENLPTYIFYSHDKLKFTSKRRVNKSNNKDNVHQNKIKSKAIMSEATIKPPRTLLARAGAFEADGGVL